MTQKRYNVVYAITDQQRYDYAGCNPGVPVQTPHLNRLASAGMVLDRFYCNNPICMPSRATIATGRTARSNRVYDNGCALPESEVTLPQVLAEHGYDTRAIGKIHLTPYGDPDGRYFESKAYWREKKSDDSPEPYAGFANAELSIGHVDHDVGHYGRWLKRNYPDIFHNWDAYLTPHPCGLNDCFNWTIPPEAHANAWIADRSIAAIHEGAARYRETGEPFFLHLGFPDPHHPFRAPEPYGSMYSADTVVQHNLNKETLKTKPPIYTEFYQGILNREKLGAGDFCSNDLDTYTDAMYRQMAATSMGMVTFVDAQFGRVMQAIEEAGLTDDTIIVFTTDHGDLMGDHRLIKKGPFLLEGSVHIPMVIRVPGVTTPNTRSDALACHMDFMPTLLDLLGIDIPRGVEGRSYRDVLVGKADRHRDGVLVEFLHQTMTDVPVKAWITDEWKLVLWGGQDQHELYNLREDPGECVNRYGDPGCGEIQQRLVREMLDEIMRSENTLPFPPSLF
ncbi:MAG: sulfatase-like hydrolase/transferase [Lentisphaerae bacterium]|nr:sulfatase-like hydrolase/transferase [Lentisphaerota bacterium]